MKRQGTKTHRGVYFIERYINYTWPNRPVAVLVKSRNPTVLEVFVGQGLTDRRHSNFELELPDILVRMVDIKSFLAKVDRLVAANMESDSPPTERCPRV